MRQQFIGRPVKNNNFTINWAMSFSPTIKKPNAFVSNISRTVVTLSCIVIAMIINVELKCTQLMVINTRIHVLICNYFFNN